MTSTTGLETTIRKYLELDAEARKRINQRSSPLDDLAYLALTLRANDVEDVIEIGTFLGQSACFLAPAIKGTYHTINVNPREVAIARENAAKFGVRNVVFHTGDSLKILPDLVEKVSPNLGAVYIDGFHSYHYSMSEFLIVEPHLQTKPCAAVFIDDAHKLHPDGATDGGVPRMVVEAGATPLTVIGSRIAVKAYGTFRCL